MLGIGFLEEMIALITLSTQTSNCPFPLATTPCVATYDVTLKVNTANITVGANGMYAGGF